MRHQKGPTPNKTVCFEHQVESPNSCTGADLSNETCAQPSGSMPLALCVSKACKGDDISKLVRHLAFSKVAHLQA